VNTQPRTTSHICITSLCPLYPTPHGCKDDSTVKQWPWTVNRIFFHSFWMWMGCVHNLLWEKSSSLFMWGYTDLYHFPHGMVLASRFIGRDTGVTKQGMMTQDEAALSHDWLLWCSLILVSIKGGELFTKWATTSISGRHLPHGVTCWIWFE
jgi:hypothetical protein